MKHVKLFEDFTSSVNEAKKDLVALQSIGAYIDQKTGMIHPMKRNGKPDLDPGMEVFIHDADHYEIMDQIEGEDKEIYQAMLKKFESNESHITEKQLKGLDGIDDETSLTEISDKEKLKIIQSTGNNISFKVPEGFDRNFWQVFSKGKIKSKKNLAGDKVFYLPGKIIDSPNFKSEKDLIDGVDWESVQRTREFNA